MAVQDQPMRPWQANMRLERAMESFGRWVYRIVYEVDVADGSRPRRFYWHPSEGWVCSIAFQRTHCFTYDNAWNLMSSIDAPPALTADESNAEANCEKPKQVGLTDSENRVLGLLTQVWNEYVGLPHCAAWGHDPGEMMHAIHAAQNIVLSRVAMRTNPELMATPSKHRKIELVSAGVDPDHQIGHCDDCQKKFKDADEGTQTCDLEMKPLTLCRECYVKRGSSVR